MFQPTPLNTKFSRHSPRSPKVTIIGAGLKGLSQLTLEGVAALKGARVVFYSRVNGSLSADHFNARVKLIDIEEGRYSVGMYRPRMYDDMARTVLEAAATDRAVVVLQPGSAIVADSVTRCILRHAADQDIKVSIINGISSIEAVLTIVGYDASDGLQVILAQHLLLQDVILSPTLASILIQPGYYDTRWWLGATRSRDGRFAQLRDQLARSYSMDAEMALVLASLSPEAAGSIFWFTLRDLDAVRRLLSPFHSLFIPPSYCQSTNPTFAQRIESLETALVYVETSATGVPVIEGPQYWFEPEFSDLPPQLVAQSEIIGRRWRERISTGLQP